MQKVIKSLDFIINWSIVLLPFSIAISSAPANVFTGLLVAAFLAKQIILKKPLFSGTPINIPLLAFFVVTCLSLVNSVNYRDSIKGGILRLLQYILVFFIVLQEVKDKKHLIRIIFSIFAGLMLISFDGIWQVATGKDFIRGYLPVLNIGLRRATASFKDSNLMGIYLSAFAPLAFGMAIYYFKSKKAIPIFLVSFISLIGIALTYSRPTLLATYIVLFFLGVASKKKTLIIILVATAFIAPFILPSSVKRWAKEMDYNPVRFMCNDDRIAVYRNSLNMIKAHPFLGVGANNYMKQYKEYKDKVEYRNIITLDYMYAHNNFIHMAAELGLLGLLIFIWVLYRLFKESSRIYRSLSDGYLKMLALA
ncbi:MAG: O-antigen ligase family protein, partial [Candidatus Omnitrophica bacterium]|nr:O-antigen ligase family protein [Candidatus Omnitrophota bacterium]